MSIGYGYTRDKWNRIYAVDPIKIFYHSPLLTPVEILSIVGTRTCEQYGIQTREYNSNNKNKNNNVYAYTVLEHASNNILHVHNIRWTKQTRWI